MDLGNAKWTFDSLEPFLAVMEQGRSYFSASHENISVTVQELSRSTSVSIAAPSRDQIETVFKVFDDDAERCRVPEPIREEEEEPEEPRIFIGHGRSPQWRDLKDHLHEKHDYRVTAFEIGARAGHSIRDVLEDMLEESSFALLVMTGEDELRDGKVLPRQNVVHEAGLFQGRFGLPACPEERCVNSSV